MRERQQEEAALEVSDRPVTVPHQTRSAHLQAQAQTLETDMRQWKWTSREPGEKAYASKDADRSTTADTSVLETQQTRLKYEQHAPRHQAKKKMRTKTQR